MSKSVKKEIEPKLPRPTSKGVDKSYPVEPDALEEQRERLRRAAAQGAGALQTTASVPPAEPSPAITTMPVKPLAPISVLWPSSIQVAEAPALTPQPPAAKAAHQPVPVQFKFLKADAKQVHVCGEFNNWSPDATPLQRRPDGQWETTLHLHPGRYQYKFVVDGQWIPDPNATENVPNQHGSLNSLLVV